jgi:hypothetical protein
MRKRYHHSPSMMSGVQNTFLFSSYEEGIFITVKALTFSLS